MMPLAVAVLPPLLRRTFLAFTLLLCALAPSRTVRAQVAGATRFVVPTIPAGARWYKTHGYAFLVLSDHNVFTDPATLASLVDSSYLLLPGEEVTTAFGHPNFLWSVDTATLFRVRNDKLLEIFNRHPLVHNLGGGDWPGMEEAWDALLTRGRL